MTEFLEACWWLSQASDSGLDSPIPLPHDSELAWLCPVGMEGPTDPFFLKESLRQCLCNIWDFGEELSANHCICFVCFYYKLFILFCLFFIINFLFYVEYS